MSPFTEFLHTFDQSQGSFYLCKKIILFQIWAWEPVIRHNDNNVILGNRNILFASIPDLLWQFFDRLLLNHRKMRETDTNCSNGKRKKGKVGRFWVIVAAIIHFWFSCNIVLPCVVNSDFSPKLHCLQTMLFVISGVEERQFLEWRGS